MVTHSILARDKDHRSRTALAGIDTVVPSPARHVPKQLLITQYRLCRRPHRRNTVLVEQHSRALKVRLPADGERQPLPLALRGGTTFALDGVPPGEDLEVSLQLRLHGLDDRVCRGAHVEAEADVAWDRVDAAWGQGEDARRGEGGVLGRDAVGVGDELGCEEDGVGAGGEWGGACVRGCSTS